MCNDGIEMSADELRNAIENLTAEAEDAIRRLDFEGYDRAYMALEQGFWILRDMMKHTEVMYENIESL